MILSPKLGNSPSIFSTISALSHKYNAVNLGQGFPDYECDKVLIDSIRKSLEAGYNQYAPMAGSPHLRETLAEKIKHCYQKSINPDSQLCITAGATQAIFTAITAFVKKGDEVIIIEPAYDCYKPAIELVGGIIKTVAIKYPDYAVDWNQLNDLVSEHTKMIIINSPHNPTGSILNRADMESLENIVQNRNIIILSDEVYEHLIYDQLEHESILKYPALFEQCLAVYSFGKTLHATGWKLGYVVGPEPLIEEFKNIHQWNVFSCNSFVQEGIAHYLRDPKVYANLPQFFQKKRDLLTDNMLSTPLQPLTCRGTYFQLYDYSRVSDLDDLSFAKFLTKEVGVAAIPLSPFYSEGSGDKVVRLCFAKKETTLHAAAQRINDFYS